MSKQRSNLVSGLCAMVVGVALIALTPQRTADAQAPAPAREVLTTPREEVQALEILQLKVQLAQQRLATTQATCQQTWATQQGELAQAQTSKAAELERLRKVHNWGSDVLWDDDERQFYRNPKPKPDASAPAQSSPK